MVASKEGAHSKNAVFPLAGLAIDIPTMLFFLVFARSSVSLDTAKVIVGENEQDATP
jgi:hypothetical protein